MGEELGQHAGRDVEGCSVFLQGGMKKPSFVSQLFATVKDDIEGMRSRCNVVSLTMSLMGPHPGRGIFYQATSGLSEVIRPNHRTG